MPKIDQRVIRVGIEVNGELRVYDGLWVSASGVKFANPLQNECEVRIANLSRDVRDYLLTETSPFNANKTPKRVVIDAGRESTGTFRLFEGDITECSPSQAPDITLTIKAKTGQFNKGTVIAKSQAPQTPLSRIAKDVAASLSLSLVFEAKDKNIANYSFSGAALKQVEKLSQAGSVNAYIDDKKLVVKDYNVPLQGVSHTLSEQTGLIGIPELTEQGVKVKYLLDPKSQLGGEIKLESKLNKAISGDYVIYKLAFEISNRDESFYTIAECKRKGTK
jgi:hypothetical protein